MRAYRSAGLTGLIVGALTGAFALTPVGLDIEEGLGLQWLFGIRGPLETPAGIVIVNTADLSPPARGSPETAGDLQACLERMRRAPRDRVPRCVFAELVDRLDQWGASVIVFDIFFGEQGDSLEDRVLAASIARAGQVVLLQRLERNPVGTGDVVIESVHSPLQPFADAAAGLGPFPMPKVPARVSQFWTFKMSAGGVATLPAVALQVQALPWHEHFVKAIEEARVRDGDGPLPMVAEIANAQDLTRYMRWLRDSVRSDRVDPERLTDAVRDVRARDLSAVQRTLLRALARLYTGGDSHFLNLYGPPGTISTIPAHAAMQLDAGSAGNALLPDIQASVVFVGRVAQSVAAQDDGHYTVFSRADGLDLSGVEIAASAYANLRNDQMLKRPNSFWILLTVIASCLLVALGSYRRSPVKFAASTIGVIGLYVIAAAVLFIDRDLWIPAVLPVIGQFVTIGVCLVLRAGFVHGPPRLVYGVCLLTDIGHFTETTEKFKLNPDGLLQRFLLRVGAKKLPLMSALRTYFRLLGTVVERQGGTVLNQVGDSMICIWQIRRPHDAASSGGREEQRSEAVRTQVCQAALEIAKHVAAFNDAAAVRTSSGERLEFPTRIGIDLGQFETGFFGGTFSTERLVVGNPANTASRLEQLNKVLGTQILASEPVIRGLERRFVTRWVGTFILSGKSEKVEVFELRRERDSGQEASEAFCRRFEDALRSYVTVAQSSQCLPAPARRQAWADVADRLSALRLECNGDGPTQFFIARAQRYSKRPPQRAPWPVRMVSKDLA